MHLTDEVPEAGEATCVCFRVLGEWAHLQMDGRGHPPSAWGQCVLPYPPRGCPSPGAGQAWAHLIVPVLLQEVAATWDGQDVPQHVLIVLPQLLHLVDLLFGLDSPQEVQAGLYSSHV